MIDVLLFGFKIAVGVFSAVVAFGLAVVLVLAAFVQLGISARKAKARLRNSENDSMWKRNP